MEGEIRRYNNEAENMLEWQPFLEYFLGANPEPGTTISIVPTLPTSTKEWDRYFVPVDSSVKSEFTTSKNTLTVLGDIGDIPEHLVDLERWVVFRENTESGHQLKLKREYPYKELDLPYHLVLASEWLFRARQVFTRQLFWELPFHTTNSIQIIEVTPDEIRDRIGDYPVPFTSITIGGYNPEYHKEVPQVNSWIKSLRRSGHRFSNFRLKTHTLCKSINPQNKIESMTWIVQYKNVQSVRHNICIRDESSYPSWYFLVNTSPDVESNAGLDWVREVKKRLRREVREECNVRFFNPMLDWESIDTDSLSDEDQYWETMSQDFPSDPDYVDDTWIHGPNLPGDVIWDIPGFLMAFLGQDPEIGTTISICNTQIFEPDDSSESNWAREDHVYLRHPSIAPESPLDVERYLLKCKNDWEEQMYNSDEEEFNWDNITLSYYLVREDKYIDGRPIEPNNLFGIQDWIERVKEVLDQDLVVELPFFSYDHETDQSWSWQTILDIPTPVQEVLGKLPPPYSQISIQPGMTRANPILSWWWKNLTTGGVELRETQQGTVSLYNEAMANEGECMETEKWTVWYRSDRSSDAPVGYALGIWSPIPDYDIQWRQHIDRHAKNSTLNRQRNENALKWEEENSDTSEESDSDISSLEEETDFRRLQCRWLGRLGPSLPPDTCQIPDWMKLVFGNKPELDTTLSICSTLRMNTTAQNQHGLAELITPFGPYTTKKRKLVVLGPMGHLPESRLDYERLTFALSDNFLGYLEEYGLADSEWSWELIKQNGYLCREQSYLEGRSFEFPVVSLEDWLIRAREVYVKQNCAEHDIIEQETLGMIKPVPGCLKNILGDRPAPGTHVSISNSQVRSKEVLETWAKELQSSGHQFTTNNQEAIVLDAQRFDRKTQDPLEDLSFVVCYSLANPSLRTNTYYVLMVEENMQGQLSREDIAKWIKWVGQLLPDEE